MNLKNQHSNFLVFLLLMISSFFIISCNSALKPEGEVKDKIISLKKFDEIKLSGKFRVVFVEDTISKVRVESYQNLIDNLSITQNGYGIYISENKKVSEDSEIYNVYIHTPKVTEIQANKNVLIDAPSMIRTQKIVIKLEDQVKFIGEIQTEDLNLEISDDSDINLKGSALKVKFISKDNSIIKAPFFVINDVELTMKGVSKAELNINKKLSGTLKDNTKLIYLGTPVKDLEQKDLATVEQK